MILRPPRSTRTDTRFPYTTLFRSKRRSQVEGLTIFGTAREKASIISFALDGIHPHDIGTIVDREGVAIRVGHHCAQPLMERFGVPATARAPMRPYSTPQEIHLPAEALEKETDRLGYRHASTEERRVGTDCDRTCRTGGTPCQTKKKKK